MKFAVVFAVMLSILLMPSMAFAEEKIAPAEQARVSNAVDNGGLVVGTKLTPTGPHRELIVPEDIRTVYAVKPIGTLKLLLEYMKDRPAEIAFRASCYASALHINPVGAATTVHLASLDYDKPIKEGHPSLRAINVKTWTRIVGKLEQEAKE